MGEVPVSLGDRVGWGSCCSGQYVVKLTLYDALLAAWKVAREFESHSLRQRVDVIAQ